MPFDAVAETLLKGGIAPRHVRRYVRELADHLDDLTAQQRAAGYDGEDAGSRARARLGGDSELAQAMLDQPGMRSWPARMPWLVLPVAASGPHRRDRAGALCRSLFHRLQRSQD